MKLLLVTGAKEKPEELIRFFVRAGCTEVTLAGNGGQARRQFSEKEYDIIFVDTPLQDEPGDELAAEAAERTFSGVLLAVRAEYAEEISSKVEEYGVLPLAKPLNRNLLYAGLKLAGAVRARLSGLSNENLRLKSKIEEIRLVDRAKCVLIERLKMTEAQAHRYIEKQAMDLRTSRREVAQGILQTYET